MSIYANSSVVLQLAMMRGLSVFMLGDRQGRVQREMRVRGSLQPTKKRMISMAEKTSFILLGGGRL